MSFHTRVFDGGLGRPLPLWSGLGDLPDDQREAARQHQLAHSRNCGTLVEQLPHLFPACLGRFVAVANETAFVADSHAAAVAWIDANHPDDHGAFVSHVVRPDVDAQGRPIHCRSSEEEEADEPSEQFLARWKAIGRNDDHLARFWRECGDELTGKFVAVGGGHVIAADTVEEALLWLRENHPRDSGAFIRYADPY